jgi:diketogulonate reductase-like aldo/keto reductase
MKPPAFLYGTAWKEEQTEHCVTLALDAGFRGIDTANQRKHYFEAAVGDALKRGLASGRVSRQELFLQTKFTFQGGQDRRLPYDPTAPIGEQVKQSFASSLEHLHTDYLDSYILHGPISGHGLLAGDFEAWRSMAELQLENKARAIGISNVNLEQLELLCSKVEVKPSFVQNRCFARTGWDQAIRGFCRENGITYQGFSLLTANTEVLKDGDFAEITTRTGCTPAQTIFAFALAIGMLPLTGTTDPEHMAEDLKAPSITLMSDDVATIESLLL